MVKGKGEPCLSAVVQCRAERRPDRPADKEDTYGGYDMHFSLYTTLCPLQNVIPMLQIGFSGALRQLRIHILRYPGIETAGKTLRAACYGFAGSSRSGYRNKRIGIGVYAPPKKRIHPFRLPRFCRNPPVGQPQKLYWYQRKGAIKKVPQAHHNYSLLIIHHSLFIGTVTDRLFFAFPCVA